jgi:hypothetical protein
MSPKKTILKALSTHYRESGPGALTRPATIPGFQTKPEKFQQAVNTLLQDRLIEGTKDPEGRMAITLNDHRIADVKKELRPFWFHPAFVAVVGVMIMALGFGLFS